MSTLRAWASALAATSTISGSSAFIVTHSLDIRLENLLCQVGSAIFETYVFVDELDGFNEVLCQSELELLISLIAEGAAESDDRRFAHFYVSGCFRHRHVHNFFRVTQHIVSHSPFGRLEHLDRAFNPEQAPRSRRCNMPRFWHGPVCKNVFFLWGFSSQIDFMAV